jgi:tetratricopeptide (TPR) repeat protein
MTNWQLNTPVVLVIFKRPDTTAKVFEAIRQAKPPKLLVIADGPRAEKPGEAEKCAATRAIIDRVDWDCQVLKNYSEINLGGRNRQVTGYTWVFNQVESAIILEDDCLPHPSFFRFCQELLEKYRQNERIMFISGNNFQFGRNRTDYDYYFSRYAHNWGWASWRRAWQKYDDRLQNWPELRKNKWLERYLENPNAVQYWGNLFNRIHGEKLKYGWDYRFIFSCWSHNGLCINPHQNLVSNIGFGAEASHTKDVNSPFSNIPVEEMNFPLKHPPVVIRHRSADEFTEKTVFSGTLPNQHPPRNRVSSDYLGHPAQSIIETRFLASDYLGYPNKSIIETRFLVSESVAKLNANQNAAALELLDKAIAAFPDQPGLNYGKAIALGRLGQIPQAIETLNNLLLVIPHHRKAQLLLPELRRILVENLKQQAIQAFNGNQNHQAFQILIQAKALKEPVIGIDYLRAIFFLRQNQARAARESLNEELRYFPENAEAQNLLKQIITQYPHIDADGNINDPEYQEIRRLVRPHTMLRERSLYSLFCLAKRVCVQNIPGDFVECGVAGGGSTLLLALVIKKYSKQPRLLYACDSFEGMPNPTENDKYMGVPADATGWGTGTCAASEARINQLCSNLGVGNLVKTVKGYFQETLPQVQPNLDRISLLHMDGDFYESTQAILANLYDRVHDDGLIQVDDYGDWEGCKKAIQEFEQSKNLSFSLHQIDGIAVWFSKPVS